MSYDLYDESIEISLEKDGEPIDKLPSHITESIDFLQEKGLDPTPSLLLPDSCKPKLGEFLVISDEDLEGDGERAVRKLIKAIELTGEEPVVYNRRIGFDFGDYPRIRAVSKALLTMKEYMQQRNIYYYFTPRMMREVKWMQQVNWETNLSARNRMPRPEAQGFGRK